MNSVTIRTARASDITRITAIYADAVLHGTASYEIAPPPQAEMAARFEAIIAAGFPWLVAEAEAGTILGYAYASHFRTRPAYRWMVEDSIYVAPDAKGRGLGTRLLSPLIDECTRLGFRQMVAVIGDGAVNVASVRLHAKLGFSHCGSIVGSGFKHGRWLDTVLMQLAMNGGNATLPDREPGAQ
jgi:L-amino acid N-acyltransferase YncA